MSEKNLTRWKRNLKTSPFGRTGSWGIVPTWGSFRGTGWKTGGPRSLGPSFSCGSKALLPRPPSQLGSVEKTRESGLYSGLPRRRYPRGGDSQLYSYAER